MNSQVGKSGGVPGRSPGSPGWLTLPGRGREPRNPSALNLSPLPPTSAGSWYFTGLFAPLLGQRAGEAPVGVWYRSYGRSTFATRLSARISALHPRRNPWYLRTPLYSLGTVCKPGRVLPVNSGFAYNLLLRKRTCPQARHYRRKLLRGTNTEKPPRQSRSISS